MPPFLLALVFDWRVWGAVAIGLGVLWLRHDAVASLKAETAAATARADQIQRTEEQRRRSEQQEAKNAHTKELAQVRADAGRAQSAAASLRQQLAGLAGSAGRDRSAAGGSPTEATVYELFARCGERYSDVARAADEAVTAGRLCERTYDALTTNAQSLRERVRAQIKPPPAKAGTPFQPTPGANP